MKIVIVETDTNDVDAEMREELLTWAQALGLDTKLACSRFALVLEPVGYWRAHFSLKRQRDGRDYVLPGTNRVAVDYDKFIAIAPMNDWPSWIDTIGDEMSDVPIPALLELLDVAAAARLHIRVTAHRRNRMGAYR